MGRGPEYAFFQRGNADGQQAHEKMLNIANTRQTQIKITMRLSPYTCQNGHHQKEPGSPALQADSLPTEL